ncbi:CRTAC1 family protein [Ulvibacterium marinum]|uniref:CRTAC1 family protein n=1 Tax=Ulvibacterium marinum TaxID=2419782 RepID=A0A3B0CAY5_9FLAO|nr:CRTAC1 family protein [Ulvibacterium marinum]RKN81149.1 CRTAC1 family protein [Ulvibacterium marinum]
MRQLLLILLVCIPMKSHGQDLLFHQAKLNDSLLGSRGVAIADLDGNGWNDIVVANQVDSVRLLGNTIYFNQGDRFIKSAIAKDNVNAWSESVHTVDVDNDHDLDLFFTTQFETSNLLYLNDGTGKFTMGKAGDLVTDQTNSPGACWCDYDFDGDLDVFLVNRDGEDDQLYINDGKGMFDRSVDGPWKGNKGDGRSCAWGDLNGDGKPDLYVANFVLKEEGRVKAKHRNYLYLSSGDGTFVEKKTGIQVEENNASYGVSFVDYDYDKDLDIYVTNVSIADENVLYQNSGTGFFKRLTNSEVTYEIHRPSKGQTWGDFNNDGRLDLYVANGTEGYPEIQNFFFLGAPDHSFKRVYNTLPAIDGHISAGTASGDFNNDGYLDLYVCNWGGEAEVNDCYINQNRTNRWVKFKLRGTTSNSYGIGSWITLTLDNDTIQTRYFSRETGYGSENSTEIHFGLGSSIQIDSVKIEWPSGIKQSGMDLMPNTVYEVIEGKEIKPIGI